MTMDRRQFLRGASAVSAATLAMIRDASAQPHQLKCRFAAHTADGKKMLAIYAKAVGMMMRFDEGDPRSWRFQWYTHMVRGDEPKASELARIYPRPSANRDLADKMWNTCEAHLDDAREDFFLPWHRMYVSWFEQIIRAVAREPDFTLPYWDYTNPDNAALPPEFLKKGDATWGALFRPDRISEVNSGKAITSWPGANPLTLNAMKSGTYSATQTDAGFCANVDQNPHGAVHVDVGDRVGMGSVPWAANDPIFWLHHCNIDRIWASWNKAGGQNPGGTSFLAEPFTFVDGNGKRVTGKVADFLTTAGYCYDTYLDRPKGSVAFAGARAEAFSPTSRSASGPLNLTTQGAAVDLRPVAGIGEQTREESFKASPARRAVFLRLENVRPLVDPGVAFDIHVNTAEGVQRRNVPSYVGSVNFFGALAHHHESRSKGRTFSFLIPEETLRLLKPGEQPHVTLVPSGKADEKAQVQIGSIAVVRTSVPLT